MERPISGAIIKSRKKIISAAVKINEAAAFRRRSLRSRVASLLSYYFIPRLFFFLYFGAGNINRRLLFLAIISLFFFLVWPKIIITAAIKLINGRSGAEVAVEKSAPAKEESRK